MLNLNSNRIRSLCIAALLVFASVAGSSEFQQQREILLREGSSVVYGLRVPDKDPLLKAIKQLGSAGTQDAIGVLTEFLTTHNMNHELKRHALVTLGQIGTKPAIEAILKFETWSQSRFTDPPPFRFGKTDYAIDHFAPIYLDPLAKATDENGKLWAMFVWSRYGRQDVWLTHSAGEDEWSQPVLLDLPTMPRLVRKSERKWDKECTLKIKNESITIICDGQAIESHISDNLTDSDNDGLPDIVEVRLLTDPNNPDSDKDGLPDGRDSNPLTPKHEDSNDVTQIRQAVFSALFATGGGRNAIVIVDRGRFAKQEYYGYAGVTLRSPKIRNGFVNVTEMSVRLESANTASATISDWEGNLAASGHRAKLKKIHGKWVVIEFGMTWIS